MGRPSILAVSALITSSTLAAYTTDNSTSFVSSYSPLRSRPHRFSTRNRSSRLSIAATSDFLICK